MAEKHMEKMQDWQVSKNVMVFILELGLSCVQSIVRVCASNKDKGNE